MNHAETEALAQLNEMDAFEKTTAGRFAHNDARNVWLFLKRDVERRVYGKPITPLPGIPNP